MTLTEFKALFGEEIANAVPLSQENIEQAVELLRGNNATEDQIAQHVARLTQRLGQKRLFYGRRSVTTQRSSIQIFNVWEQDLDTLYESLKTAKPDAKNPSLAMPWFTEFLE
jgi:hypothetical protein